MDIGVTPSLSLVEYGWVSEHLQARGIFHMDRPRGLRFCGVERENPHNAPGPQNSDSVR